MKRLGFYLFSCVRFRVFVSLVKNFTQIPYERAVRVCLHHLSTQHSLMNATQLQACRGSWTLISLGGTGMAYPKASGVKL